jgi:hypothetical protein
LFTFPTSIFALCNSLHFHLQEDVIYCDISAGSGRTCEQLFKL